MRDVNTLLDDVYAGQERVSRAEIHRRAVAADAPAEVVTALDGLPEGEYTHDEVADALGRPTSEAPERPTVAEPAAGVPGDQLSTDDLFRELGELYRTRLDALRHASDQAFARHGTRTEELENEYLSRFPQREVDPERLRSGVRERG